MSAIREILGRLDGRVPVGNIVKGCEGERNRLRPAGIHLRTGDLDSPSKRGSFLNVR